MNASSYCRYHYSFFTKQHTVASFLSPSAISPAYLRGYHEYFAINNFVRFSARIFRSISQQSSFRHLFDSWWQNHNPLYQSVRFGVTGIKKEGITLNTFPFHYIISLLQFVSEHLRCRVSGCPINPAFRLDGAYRSKLLSTGHASPG